jgi:hypothetical protein
MSINETKPAIFLSFAGENLEWKRTLMKRKWWEALLRVAEIHDYDERPQRTGNLLEEMEELVLQSSAFIVILSKYYLRDLKAKSVLEREFMTAVKSFSASSEQGRFYPIVIDDDAKRWWDEKKDPIFAENTWLRDKIYWELTEQSKPALLEGPRGPHYAIEVRDYAEEIAATISALGATRPKSSRQSPLLVLGNPKPTPQTEGSESASIAKDRNKLITSLRARGVQVEDWQDGWIREKTPSKESTLKSSLKGVVRSIGADEARDVAISPRTTADQLSYLAGSLDVSKLKITFWLPTGQRNSTDTGAFLEKCKDQPLDANPRFCTAPPQDLAEILVPLGGQGSLTQISMEILDDRQVIEDGRTARKIVEEKVKECVSAGASLARIQNAEPLVRHFISHTKLANQISEARGGRVILVAHDMNEHPASTYVEARQIVASKVRRFKEAVESVLGSVRGRLIPITIIVTNFELLRNDLMLDEEIAGLKWRLLPGRVDKGKFQPEQESQEFLVNDIASVLGGRGQAVA